MRWLLLIGALVVPAGIAEAHIHLTNPLSRTDLPTGDQKEQHCGVLNQQRTTRVTTYKPGQTITVTWQETINHPGHFRIAFQPNGDIFGIPEAGAGAGGFPDKDLTGMTDGNNGSIVLKDMIADGTLQTDITLPNMECSNCTLQFIQVMTDKPPYTTDAASDDIYFNCADIVLATDAPDAGPSGGGADGGTGSGSNNNNQAEIGGGCSAGGGAGGTVALALLGLVGLRRRR
ncbi:MAG: lytic polysaccharide monooxygenase [Kofleriaceae bacterium]|nr:lytic polysaccharide monooxygenase [Kofleriaceae bacterium]